MAPAQQVSGPLTFRISIGEYGESRPSPRRTFALHLELAGATAGDKMEAEQMSQCSACCRWRSVDVLALTAIKRSFGAAADLARPAAMRGTAARGLPRGGLRDDEDCFRAERAHSTDPKAPAAGIGS